MKNTTRSKLMAYFIVENIYIIPEKIYNRTLLKLNRESSVDSLGF